MKGRYQQSIPAFWFERSICLCRCNRANFLKKQLFPGFVTSGLIVGANCIEERGVVR
jgi:hypothetical protein